MDFPGQGCGGGGIVLRLRRDMINFFSMSMGCGYFRSVMIDSGNFSGRFISMILLLKEMSQWFVNRRFFILFRKVFCGPC